MRQKGGGCWDISFFVWEGGREGGRKGGKEKGEGVVGAVELSGW